MKLAAFIQKLDKVIGALETDAPKINLRMAANAKADIQERVQDKGLKANGSSFENYSTNPLPLFFFEGKSNRKSAAAKITSKNYPNGLSYAGFRQLNGLQTAFVDLTFSGDMFRDIKARQKGPRGRHVYTAKIGAERKDNQDKIRWNTRKKGVFLALTTEEKEKIKASYKLQIENLIKRNLQ
jgi:hypothetical protein